MGQWQSTGIYFGFITNKIAENYVVFSHLEKKHHLENLLGNGLAAASMEIYVRYTYSNYTYVFMAPEAKQVIPSMHISPHWEVSWPLLWTCRRWVCHPIHSGPKP